MPHNSSEVGVEYPYHLLWVGHFNQAVTVSTVLSWRKRFALNASDVTTDWASEAIHFGVDSTNWNDLTRTVKS